MKNLLVSGGAAFLLLVSGSTLAQQFTETVDVTVVEVPVTVVDRAGKAVTDLTLADFEVVDDGRKVELTGFEVLHMRRYEEQEDNATPLQPAAYRNFLLLFDLAHSSPITIGRAQEAALEFVRDQISRRDLAAVATFSSEHGLQLLTSFTTDVDLLQHAISTLGVKEYFNTPDPLRIAAPPSLPREVREGTRGDREGAVAEAISRLLQLDTVSQRAQDHDARSRLRRQFAQFGSVARALDSLRGQKQVILLSEGFDPRHVQGRQDLSFQATQRDNDATARGEIWDVDTEKLYGSSASNAEIAQMAELFRRSDVRLHAIDIKGLRTDVDAAAGARRTSNEALHLLARPTGGSVFKNANDLRENFSSLIEQQETVYLLAFEAKAAQSGKFHPLKVRVPKLRGATVTHRSGYYEAARDVSPLERTLSLADIMMTEAPVRDIPLSVRSIMLPSRSGAARIPVVVELPGPPMLVGVTGPSVTANVFVYAFDEQFRVRDFLQQRIGLDLARNGEAIRAAGVRYVGMLEVPAGAEYAIKALVQIEESGRVGFLRTDLSIPQAGGPRILPPVFTDERPGWINVAAPGRGSSAVYAFTAAGRAFAPERNATLRNDTARRIALFVHETPTDSLDITPVVVAADGTSLPAPVALVGRTPPDAEGSAKIVLELKPAKMAAGDYVLKFTVAPKGGESAVFDLPFRIE